MIEVGQVLSLIIRYNNNGDISNDKHPYLIVNIDNEDLKIEIAQFDKIKGKEHKLLFKSNKLIRKNNEVVIDEDSFIQMDNQFILEKYDGLDRFKRQEDKLSEDALKVVIKEYYDYHKNHHLNEVKCVYIDKDELETLNN